MGARMNLSVVRMSAVLLICCEIDATL
jgi:hypothetical protein